MVAPTPMETARSLIAQIADRLLAVVWALAIGSIPGMAAGLIPWSVFGLVWGVAVLAAVAAGLSERAAPPRPAPASRARHHPRLP